MPQGGAAYASGDLAAFSASSMANPPQLHTNALLEMMEAMRRANVATYAIDPRGAVKAGDLSAECFPARAFGAAQNGNDPVCVDDPSAGAERPWMSPVRQAQHGLSILETAVATGGFAVTNTDDFTGGLSRILEDLDHYYLVGFYPERSERQGLSASLERPCLPDHPDWTLRFRRGYMGGSAKPAPKRIPKSNAPMTLSRPSVSCRERAICRCGSRRSRRRERLSGSAHVDARDWKCRPR